jgi:hypothetical protein
LSLHAKPDPPGDYERATELFEESLAIGEARGDLDRRARQLVNLGVAAHGLGDTLRAHDRFCRGLTTAQEIGLVEAELNALLGVAACESASGDAVKAAQVLGWTQAAESRLGSGTASEDSLTERTLASLRESLGADRLEAELTAGAALSHEDAVSLALGPT